MPTGEYRRVPPAPKLFVELIRRMTEEYLRGMSGSGNDRLLQEMLSQVVLLRDEFQSTLQRLSEANELDRNRSSHPPVLDYSRSCQKHPKQELSLYCVQCSELMCVMCAFDVDSAHKGHPHQLPQNVLSEEKTNLQSACDAAATLETQLQQTQANIASRMQDTSSSVASLLSAINHARVELMTAIDQKSRRLMTQAQNYLQDTQTELKKELQGLSRHRGAVVEALILAKQCSDEPNALPFLKNKTAAIKQLNEASQQATSAVQTARAAGLSVPIDTDFQPIMAAIDRWGTKHTSLHESKSPSTVPSASSFTSPRSMLPAAPSFPNKVSLSIGQVGAGRDQFQNPYFLAVDTSSGLIFTADCDKHSVLCFDIRGAHKWTIGGQGGVFRYPRGVAVDETASELYVADSGNNRIVVLDYNGRFLRNFGSLGGGYVQFRKMNGLAFQPRTKTLFVCDTDNSRVQMLDSNGSFKSQFPFASYTPYAVAVDPASDVFAVTTRDNRLLLVRNDQSFFAANVNELRSPRGLCIDSASSRIFVADCDNNAVFELSLSGELKGKHQFQGRNMSGPMDVKLDNQRGMSFVLERKPNYVCIQVSQ